MRNILLILIFIQSSCSQKANYGKPVIESDLIVKSLATYRNYRNAIKLSDDFIGLDSSEKIIDKNLFLSQLSSGNYLPLRLRSKKRVYYKLERVDNWIFRDMPIFFKNIAKVEQNNYKMENRVFPSFNLTDIQGNIVSSEMFKGKILVLKLWFINCQACVEEIPSLNKLMEVYKTRKDIKFVSMALDKNEELLKFLNKKEFNYTTIGNQENFLEHNLQIKIYPTHIIVNRKGLISKVVNSFEELEKALKKESIKK